jgi:hypothetical protein
MRKPGLTLKVFETFVGSVAGTRGRSFAVTSGSAALKRIVAREAARRQPLAPIPRVLRIMQRECQRLVENEV